MYERMNKRSLKFSSAHVMLMKSNYFSTNSIVDQKE